MRKRPPSRSASTTSRGAPAWPAPRSTWSSAPGGGLFDPLTTELWDRAGLPELTRAVAHPDALEHLRGGLRAAVEIYAAIRGVAAALFSMSALDPESVGGAIARMEERRWGGMRYLAHRLDEQGLLRPM